MKKRCTKCGVEKSATLEYFHARSATRDGLQSRCKDCRNANYKKYRKTDAGKKARRKSRSKRTEQSERKWGLKYRYGITFEQHKQVYIKQNGCCAICNISVKYSEIQTDHDHKTGKIRGLLCRCCNTGIGFLKDNIEIMQNAIKYLKN